MKVRLLPILIFAACLMLFAKVNGIWHGLSPVFVAAGAVAQETPATGDSAADNQAAETRAEAAAGRDAAGRDAERQGDGMADGQAGLAADGEPAVRAEDPLDLSDEEILLLQQLSKRREEIELRAQEVEQRAALLQAAEQRIEQKVDELKELQATIQGMLVEHDEQEEAQMRSLVKIYESMKPKEAARIFEELDMVVLLEVVDRMSERRVAPVLAKMNPAKAKAVTLELAQRRELPIAKD